MESDPAACQGQALVPYLKLVQQYLRQGHAAKANCSELAKRLSKEQKMAEDALQAILARSDTESDLSELKHAIEVASAAGIADNIVASAQTFVSDIQRKRETIAQCSRRSCFLSSKVPALHPRDMLQLQPSCYVRHVKREQHPR